MKSQQITPNGLPFVLFILQNNQTTLFMQTYMIEILNPKAVRLLEDLADLQLLTFRPNSASATQPTLTDIEKAKAHEAVMRGSPNMDLDRMLEHLRESRQDRKLPFRDDE